METDKLYYADSHLREFSARVIACREAENGFLVALSATAFYPEGGGQACDLGQIEGVRVLDVREKEGIVWHLCQAALTEGSTVTGVSTNPSVVGV